MTSMIRPLPTVTNPITGNVLPKLVHELTKQDLEERYGRLKSTARVREARKRYCAEYNQSVSPVDKLMNRFRIKAVMLARRMSRMPAQDRFSAYQSGLSRFISSLKGSSEEVLKSYWQAKGVLPAEQELAAGMEELRSAMDPILTRFQSVVVRKMNRAEIRARKPGRDATQEIANAHKEARKKYIKMYNTECENCHTSALEKALDKCSHCYTVYYCGKECITARWRAHKAEWLQRDAIVQEVLVGRKPQPDSAFAFTEELCELISSYDHIPAKKA